MMKINEFLKFFKLALNRSKSDKNYIKFQNYQAKLILNELENKGISLDNLKVIELGCGRGGYSIEIYKKTKDLTLADMNKPKILLKKYPKLKFKRFDFSKKFPIKNNQFDFIFCLSTIEHIKNPLDFLKECNRILRKNGTMLLAFPPFYSPVGGHIVKPFHYLGEKTAIKLANLIKRRNIKSYDKMFGDWGLYKLKIDDIKKLINKTDFKIVEMWVRYSPINFSKIPLLKDYLSWNVHFLLQK